MRQMAGSFCCANSNGILSLSHSIHQPNIVEKLSEGEQHKENTHRDFFKFKNKCLKLNRLFPNEAKLWPDIVVIRMWSKCEWRWADVSAKMTRGLTCGGKFIRSCLCALQYVRVPHLLPNILHRADAISVLFFGNSNCSILAPASGTRTMSLMKTKTKSISCRDIITSNLASALLANNARKRFHHYTSTTNHWRAVRSQAAHRSKAITNMWTLHAILRFHCKTVEMHSKCTRVQTTKRCLCESIWAWASV